MVSDNKTRCRCCSGTCSCERAGMPVPVPAKLPGRLAALTASTGARRPVGGTTAAVRRTPEQEARRRAAQEQVFRSQPAQVRRAFGYRGGTAATRTTPPRRLVDQVSPVWREAFRAGGFQGARELGNLMREAERRNLPADPTTGIYTSSSVRNWQSGNFTAVEPNYRAVTGRLRALIRQHDEREVAATMAAIAARVAATEVRTFGPEMAQLRVLSRQTFGTSIPPKPKAKVSKSKVRRAAA